MSKFTCLLFVTPKISLLHTTKGEKIKEKIFCGRKTQRNNFQWKFNDFLTLAEYYVDSFLRGERCNVVSSKHANLT